MNTQDATFLLLHGRQNWRTATSTAISVGQDALRLVADPHGPLGLTWRDGSLGGLRLPRGLAIDQQQRVYLLAEQAPWTISRFVSASQGFVALPGLGGAGQAVRQFQQPRTITIAGQYLYVADTDNRRVQVFDCATLALLYLWNAPTTQPWLPVDLATTGACTFVLDSQQRRIYRHHTGDDDLRLFVDGNTQNGNWEQVAADQAGRVYVLERTADATYLRVYDQHGKPEQVRRADGQLVERLIHDAGEIRDRFAPPAIRLLYDQQTRHSYFCLPASLNQPCQPTLPTRAPAPEQPLATCLPSYGQPDGLMFDRVGARVRLDPSALREMPLYLTHGTWESQSLDSTIYQCQWHRVELELEPLPPGTQILVESFSSDDASVNLPAAGSPAWQIGYQAIGQLQPASAAATDQPAAAPTDFLIQSRQGQYLWLKITLLSDGFATPVVRGMRVHFPRESYLAYLPAIYSADDTNRWFLERYLSLFQTEWDALERRITSAIALFDPDAVPGGPFLDALAHNFGLPIEGDWSAEQRRTLLQSMRRFYTSRGTLAGLRAYLQAYLQNMSGYTPALQGDFPVLIEGWRERRRLELGTPDSQNRHTFLPLWSPSMVGRLQTGSHARLGEARLVDTGEPSMDRFSQFANRFTIYLPAAWVQSAADERRLRRALEAEKPAHLAYELKLVAGRFRVGVQSTIGLDTILGDIPTTRLAGREVAASQAGQEPAPSQPVRQRLGYDTVLAARTAPPAAPILVTL